MEVPEDSPDQPYPAAPHIPTNAFGRPVPPRPSVARTDQDLAREQLADAAKPTCRHRPASAVAGICSGAIASALLHLSLTRSSIECDPLLHRQPDAAWCPIMRGPYFDVAAWTLVLSFVLALIAYGTVHAILHLRDEAGGYVE